MKRSNKAAREVLNKTGFNLLPVQSNSSFAFTLAEVLITLAIIGVVAALTIPSVVQNYQKHQTVIRLKKAYSALANTTSLAIVNEGPIGGWEIEDGKSEDFANKYLIPYLKVSKNCGIKTQNDCKFAYNYLDNSGPYTHGSNVARFYLTDGVLIGVIAQNGESENALQKTARIIIDINGDKKPNMVGKDIFYFTYYIFYRTPDSNFNGKFMPWAYSYTRADLMNSNYNSCNKNSNGIYCTALILKDGWRIADDYPW